jgi:hypothetical protein
MKIAIIDSGVDLTHSRFYGSKISGFGIKYDRSNIEYIEDFHDEHGHGTALVGIILKHISQVEIIAIKIFFQSLIVNEKVVHEAINWCVDNKIDIINLSLGIEKVNFSNELYNICFKAYKKNILIIAAGNNIIKNKSNTYPASFPFVYGVDCGLIKKSNSFGYIESPYIAFLAKGSTQRVCWKDNKYNIVQGSSFACAHFTGLVGRMIVDILLLNKNSEEIRKTLISMSNKSIKPWIYSEIQGEDEYHIVDANIEGIGGQLFNNSQRLSWIKNVAIFSGNEKEMNIFTKDIPILKKVNVKFFINYPLQVNSIFHDLDNQINSINRFPNKQELDTIDSIVIGYYLDQLFEANIKFGNELLRIAIINNINIFYFDSRLNTVIQELKILYNSNIVTYCPGIKSQDYEALKVFKFLPEVKSPVMAVIGTSSKQGKFTSQLKILEIMLNEGYNVSFLSTEPQGELLSASFSFPYGYLSSVNIGSNRWIDILEMILKGIQFINTPDFIITGIQSGLIPRVFNSNDCYKSALNSLTFLCGIRPDIFICAINPDDQIEDIVNTIETAKIFTGAKFLFCVLSPFIRTDNDGNEFFKKLSKVEFNNVRENIILKLNIPVIDIMDKSNNSFILDIIEKTLTHE